MNDIAVHKESVAHDRRNMVLLTSLAEKGVDLQAERPIEIFFYAASESDAHQLARALKPVELEVVRTGPPSGPNAEWCVEARAHAAPQAVAAREYTRSLVILAAAHNARYDGWGTEV
jgi:regulator of RNase E activity RraB